MSLDFVLDSYCAVFCIAWLQLKLFRENEAFDLVNHTLLPVGFYLLLFTRLAVSLWVCLFHSFLMVPFYFIPHFPTLFFFMSELLPTTIFYSLQLYTLDAYSSQRFVLDSHNSFNMFPGKILNLYLLTWIFLSWCLYSLCHLQSCHFNIVVEISQSSFPWIFHLFLMFQSSFISDSLFFFLYTPMFVLFSSETLLPSVTLWNDQGR